MNADPTERPMYNVFLTYPGEPASTPERKNDAPLGIVDAVSLGAYLVTDMQCNHGYLLDPSPVTNSAARQRWYLRRRGMVALVDVCEEAQS